MPVFGKPTCTISRLLMMRLRSPGSGMLSSSDEVRCTIRNTLCTATSGPLRHRCGDCESQLGRSRRSRSGKSPPVLEASCGKEYATPSDDCEDRFRRSRWPGAALALFPATSGRCRTPSPPIGATRQRSIDLIQRLAVATDADSESPLGSHEHDDRFASGPLFATTPTPRNQRLRLRPGPFTGCQSDDLVLSSSRSGFPSVFDHRPAIGRRFYPEGSQS